MPRSRTYNADRLWFRCPLELGALCAALQPVLKLGEIRFDSENLYEWAEADSVQGEWGINISRKHRGGTPLPNEPFHVLTTGNPPRTAELAAAVCPIAHADVFWGRIEYVGGEDFAYHATGSCRP